MNGLFPRNRLLAWWGGGAVLASLLLPAAPAARADLLRLENGRTVHGTVDRTFVDEEALRIQIFSTGGTVRVRWEHLIAEDREKWQVDLGLKESEEAKELKIDALKVRLVAGAKIFYGLCLNPEALDGPATGEVRFLVKGSELKWNRGELSSWEPVRVDLALILTPRQAFERKRDELNPAEGRAWFDLAEYARAVGAYAEAKECYDNAKRDPVFADTHEGRLVDSRLATLDVLLRNKSLQEEIDRIKVTLIQARGQTDFVRSARTFLDAREAVFALSQKVTDPKVQKELRLPELALKIESDRRKFFEAKLPLEVYNRVRRLIEDKAKEQKERDFPPTMTPAQRAAAMLKGTFEGARQYAGRGVVDDLWTGLMKDVGAADILAEMAAQAEKDPTKVTDADREKVKRLATMDKALRQELLDFWAHRSKSNFNITSYGYGTFIVAGNTLKLTRKQPPQGRGGNNRGGQGAGGSSQQAVDVIKTPDQWWEEASRKERKDWLLSWCAERSGLFEAFRTWDEPCDACGGLGYKKTSVAATGEEEASRCTTCNGAKVERKVKWR